MPETRRKTDLEGLHETAAQSLDRAPSDVEAASGNGHEPAYPQSLGAKLRHLQLHLRGLWLMRKLKHRHRTIVRDLHPFALHLEKEVFPLLLDEHVGQIEIRPVAEGNTPRLEGSAGKRSLPFPATATCAQWLLDHDIRSVRLDTHLESGQILEAMLVLFHTVGFLGQVEASSECYKGWAPDRTAAALVSPSGYHKFCALMRFDVGRREFRADYSYCDLIFSRMVTSYIEHRPFYRDHRTLFSAAPRFAVLIWLLLVLPLVLLLLNPVWGAVVAVAVSIMIALGAGAAVFTLASVQYAREHHDSLRQELLRQVTSLARFPEANPNPIWRLTADAEILYHNPAVHRLLDELQIPHPNACELLPNECETLTRECIENAPHSREAEFEARGRTFHYLFRPFPDEHSVIAAGVDVTYLKRIENELRQLNENLEEKVRERTTELRETQDVTILSLAGLAETRDKETGAHLERTRRYVRMLAQQLRTSPRFRDFLDDRVIEHLFNSAPLHDIGKVGVRDAILLKPGKLTPEEFEEMKQHTIYGGDALRWASERLGFDSFLRLGQDIAYNHHERWDGSGYPRGLKGDEIPWAARLMALADYYDALISKRVYKEAYTHERARTMIIEGQGKHFDPEVVEAFLSREDDFIRVAEEYVDEE